MRVSTAAGVWVDRGPQVGRFTVGRATPAVSAELGGGAYPSIRKRKAGQEAGGQKVGEEERGDGDTTADGATVSGVEKGAAGGDQLRPPGAGHTPAEYRRLYHQYQ